MKVVLRIIKWIIRIILFLGVVLAGYLAYQNFFNDTKPKQALDILMSKSEEWMQTVSQTVQETIEEAPSIVSLWTDQKVCYRYDCYTVEIVDTPASRQKWLMFREELAQNKGMLFVFNTPSNYNFRMKNTKLSLDMIRIDANYKILYINENTPPCTADPCPNYGPKQAEALYVLEINGWEAKDWKVGENVEFKNL